MKNRLILLSIFLIFLLQISVPLYNIYKYEQVIENGKTYKFKCKPIDPYDPFRGKFVVLGFEQDKLKMKDDEKFQYKDKAYAILKENSNGYAEFKSLDLEKPQNADFLKVKTTYYMEEMQYLTIPFDRYYMDENKAVKAEILLRNNFNGEFINNVYVEVRVLNGIGIIKNLYVDGIRIEDYVGLKN